MRLARAPRALMLVAALALPWQGTSVPASAQTAQRSGAPVHEEGALRLPALGESAAEDFGVGVERRLGNEIMAEIRRDPAYLDDPVLLQYLQSLWQPLVVGARAGGGLVADMAAQFAWEAFLVRDKSVNAFALPGGFVGVHLGLIAMTQTRDQLASVLAHELTHVTQRHIARSIAVQQRQTLLSVAGMIVALLAASRANSPDLMQAAIMGSQAAAIQGQLNFSRDMEREADRIGFALLDGAGFDHAGMSSMFELLDRANRFNDSSAYPYLRSHPLTHERQSEARLRLHGAPASAAPAAVVAAQHALHELMAARASVLMDPSVAALRRLQELPAPPKAPRLAALYASALASSLLNEHALAVQRIEQARTLLAAQASPQPELLRALALLQVETTLAAGDAAAALQQLGALRRTQGEEAAEGAAGTGSTPSTASAPPNVPSNVPSSAPTGMGMGMNASQGGWPGLQRERPLLMLQAQVALRLGPSARPAALREVSERLQTWVTLQPQDATAWLLLGNCAEAQGQRLRALRAQAEARALLGDLTGALDRLRSGRALARSGGGQDFVEASIIEARWRELQARRRALLAERGLRVGDREPGDEEPARP
jgi:predicted Zn-dependent protease